MFVLFTCKWARLLKDFGLYKSTCTAKHVANLGLSMQAVCIEQITSSVQNVDLCSTRKNSDETKINMRQLTKACELCYRFVQPSKKHSINRAVVMLDLETLLSQILKNDFYLKIYGSAANKFAQKDGDLDIMLNATLSTKQYKFKILPQLMSAFKRSGRFRTIQWVSSPRTSVLKFTHVNRVQADLVFRNPLGVENSMLIKRYATIDHRFLLLGHCLKHLTKQCQVVGNVYMYLSSYAYVLMVIHYLQQLPTPVLPLLQQIGREPKSFKIRQGHDCWYYMGNLEGVWEQLGKNKESAGDLWLGLLRFYAREFDFEKDVISVRKLNVGRSEKLGLKISRPKKWEVWNEPCWCIEDPFEVNRNLAAHVTNDNKVMIREMFERAYCHFSTPTSEVIESEDLMEYYFQHPNLQPSSTQQS